MKLKNIWKYIALISFINLLGILLYIIGLLVVCGIDILPPLWISQWLGVSIFLILFSVFIAVIGNIREIISGVIQFLND